MIKRISPKRKKELAEYTKTMKEMEKITYCENCKRYNGLTWGGISHHHIVYRSEAPKHENLHNRKNVIKLCNRCHTDYHKEKDSRKHLVIDRKLWELFPELRLKERYFEN